MFGMSSKQIDDASKILQELGRSWRDLVAGSEGYLTAKGRVGLQSQAVVWGDMVFLPVKGSLYSTDRFILNRVQDSMVRSSRGRPSSTSAHHG